MATVLIIFPKNKLTKLANFVQFKRMLKFCLEDWGWKLGALGPLVYATALVPRADLQTVRHANSFCCDQSATCVTWSGARRSR